MAKLIERTFHNKALHQEDGNEPSNRTDSTVPIGTSECCGRAVVYGDPPALDIAFHRETFTRLRPYCRGELERTGFATPKYLSGTIPGNVFGSRPGRQ